MDCNGLADPPGLRDPSKMAETAARLVRDMASKEGMSGQNNCTWQHRWCIPYFVLHAKYCIRDCTYKG